MKLYYFDIDEALLQRAKITFPTFNTKPPSWYNESNGECYADNDEDAIKKIRREVGSVNLIYTIELGVSRIVWELSK